MLPRLQKVLRLERVLHRRFGWLSADLPEVTEGTRDFVHRPHVLISAHSHLLVNEDLIVHPLPNLQHGARRWNALHIRAYSLRVVDDGEENSVDHAIRISVVIESMLQDGCSVDVTDSLIVRLKPLLEVSELL